MECFTRAAIGNVLFSPYMAIFLSPESQGVFYVAEIHKWSHSLSQTCYVALKLTSLSLLLYPKHTFTCTIFLETMERYSFLFSQKYSVGWISTILLLYARERFLLIRVVLQACGSNLSIKFLMSGYCM